MTSSPASSGKVFLVGAGPGDPGLLTVKGLEVLQSADVVVYDYLANQELLLETKPGAELVYVGMHADERLTQDAINRLLAGHASRGKMVCRLKGGDPFVFGRGGEEAEFIAKAGIAFAVVPGVSAGYAVPAYAGIPLTHRHLSSSVLFITGHEDPEKESTAMVEWEKIAHGASTLVFFMGVRTLPEIAEKLMAAGRSAGTPVALIRWGTRGEQQVATGTLEDIGERVRQAGLKPPALTIVGEVVRLRETLCWFEAQPLFGQRCLVTRPREQAQELAAPLRALGAETLILPTIAIRDPGDWAALDAGMDTALDAAGRYDWLIFTSANGVRQFMKRMGARGIDIRSLTGIRICAIGPATAAELGKNLLRVDLVPRDYVAEGVIEAFASEDLQGKRILLPRARVARDVLPEALSARGAIVDVVEAYQTVLPAESVARSQTIFERHRPTVITFTSSSSVRNLFRILEEGKVEDPFRDVKIASIGPVTSATLQELGHPPDIQAREFTVAGLVQAIVGNLAK